MSDIAAVYLHLNFDLSHSDFEATREYLIGMATRYSSIIYRQKLNIRVELQDGSVKAWILVAGSIYVAIGQYDSFRSGIDQIIKDAKSIKEYIVDTLVKDGVSENRIIEVKRNHCLPDRIRRLFLRIDRFEKHIADTSPIEKAREAELIVRAAARISDELGYQEDLDQFLSCLDDRFKPSPERLVLRSRPTARRENDFTYQFSIPHVADELLLDSRRSFELSSTKNTLQLSSAPLALRSQK